MSIRDQAAGFLQIILNVLQILLDECDALTQFRRQIAVDRFGTSLAMQVVEELLRACPVIQDPSVGPLFCADFRFKKPSSICESLHRCTSQ